MKANVVAANLASALELSLGLCAQPVPKGFRTKDEWAKVWKCHETMAWKLCKRHVKDGRMIFEQFRIDTGNQRNRKVIHYKAVK